MKVCTANDLLSIIISETKKYVGIRECEIIQWFVEPGARVEEFDKICEVQSDKASVDIPSRFSGVIKKLHYEAGEMAIVGKALIDIDVPEEVAEAVEKSQGGPIDGAEAAAESMLNEGLASTIQPDNKPAPAAQAKQPEQRMEANTGKPMGSGRSKHATFATPAVRHISKELGVDISLINGSGKDGRVTKDDVYQFAKMRDQGRNPTQTQSQAAEQTAGQSSAVATRPAKDHGPQTETVQPLSTIQSMMFKSMTASLRIPHFLYSDEVCVNSLMALRKRINKSLKHSPAADGAMTKVSMMPFLVKAMSLALDKYPILNARVEAQEGQKPNLVMRKQHNIGVAMDTPQGLIVPVIKNVATLSILDIAAELNRLQSMAKVGKLSTADLSGGTITLSNIGNIGGTVVAPVIVEKEVAILGIGKMRTVPAFGEDGELVKKDVMNMSWSADHRVVDGATMARAAEVVRGFVEEPDMMIMHLS